MLTQRNASRQAAAGDKLQGHARLMLQEVLLNRLAAYKVASIAWPCPAPQVATPVSGGSSSSSSEVGASSSSSQRVPCFSSSMRCLLQRQALQLVTLVQMTCLAQRRLATGMPVMLLNFAPGGSRASVQAGHPQQPAGDMPGSTQWARSPLRTWQAGLWQQLLQAGQALISWKAVCSPRGTRALALLQLLVLLAPAAVLRLARLLLLLRLLLPWKTRT